MSSKIVVPFHRRDPRERLAVEPAPQPKPFVVFARGAPQSAHLDLGEASEEARAFALNHPGDPVQVLQLMATYQTATVVRESRP